MSNYIQYTYVLHIDYIRTTYGLHIDNIWITYIRICIPYVITYRIHIHYICPVCTPFKYVVRSRRIALILYMSLDHAPNILPVSSRFKIVSPAHHHQVCMTQSA